MDSTTPRDTGAAGVAPPASGDPLIRIATRADAERLAWLGARAFTAAYQRDLDPVALAAHIEYAFAPEAVAAELQDPATVFLLAQDDGDQVGFAKLVEGDDTPAAGARRPIQLARLYVAASRAGTGVDGRLMQAALEEAARRGCDRMWLGVWERDASAMAFYERWGFVEVGRQPFTMDGTVHRDVLMVRAVSDGPAGTMSATNVDEGAAR